MRISLEEAIDLLHRYISPLSSARLPLFETLGCITDEEIKAEIDQPPFPRSPYDGYALRAQDSVNASSENPVMLLVTGTSYAGITPEVTVGPGEAVRIMTGGVIPEGADCIIPQEKTNRGDPQVAIYKSLRPFENYCRQGEDFLCGSCIVARGIPVTSAVASVAASSGCGDISVFPKPKVAIISTGDELQIIGQPLRKGQIYNSNSTLLSGRLSELRISVSENINIRDNISELTRALESANITSDIIICTGGVSVGERDLVPNALEMLGAEIIFHGVEIKPGMPAVFALLQGKPILALSGNPFACAVSFEMLVRPSLAILSSDPRIDARHVRARLVEDFTRKNPIRRFQRGVLSDGTVTIPGEQGNGQMRTMIGCNCLVELPPSTKPLCSGTPVEVYLLE